jgi:hypothetical protein
VARFARVEGRMGKSHSGEALIIFGAMYEASNTLEDGAVEVRPANMDNLHQIEGPRASFHRQETVRAHLFCATGDLSNSVATP